MNRVVLAIVVVISFFACQSNESGTSSVASANGVLVDGTADMVRMLDSIANNENPQLAYNLNSKMAGFLKSQADAQTDVNNKFVLTFKYANELVNAGKTTDGIVLLEQLIQQLEAQGLPLNESNRTLYDILAVAYLRLGEQQNCIENHNDASCILPLSGKAIYGMKSGSEKAIEVYKRLLTAFPNDLQTRWLLNFAYMTIGQYPAGVPKQWLVPNSVFAMNDANWEPFAEVAIQKGVNVQGLSGGVCLEDFNNDGWLDIFCTSYGLTDNCQLFMNDTKGGYTNATEKAGLKGLLSGLNTTHADFDNDGDIDIFILRGGWLNLGGKHPNSLLRNNGDGTFSDVTKSAGLLSFYPTQTAAWADVNQDGWLDLFVGNEASTVNGQKLEHPCELFISNKNGTFTNQSQAMGVSVTEFVKGVTFGDVNNDGYPDLYISILGAPNRLFMNQGGTKMVEQAAQAGVSEPKNSFPTWFFDVDQDGFQDLFVGGYDADRLAISGEDLMREFLNMPTIATTMHLFRNKGDETFEDVTTAYQLNKVAYAMGSNFGDLDNDGFLDMYLGTGTPDYRSILPNRMFKNVNGKQFKEVTMGGFGHLQKGHGVAFGDVDNDGDQDIYCVVGGAYQGDIGTNILFENPSQKNAWITIRLQGKTASRCAIGAKICVTTKNKNGKIRKHFQWVNTGGSFGAASLQQEFGLGDAVSVEQVEVWFSGKTSQVWTGVGINGVVLLEEGNEVPLPLTNFKGN